MDGAPNQSAPDLHRLNGGYPPPGTKAAKWHWPVAGPSSWENCNASGCDMRSFALKTRPWWASVADGFVCCCTSGSCGKKTN